jgi:hypothetical protein
MSISIHRSIRQRQEEYRMRRLSLTTVSIQTSSNDPEDVQFERVFRSLDWSSIVGSMNTSPSPPTESTSYRPVRNDPSSRSRSMRRSMNYRMSNENFQDESKRLFRNCLHCTSPCNENPLQVSVDSERYFESLMTHHGALFELYYVLLVLELSRCRKCFVKFKEIAMVRHRGRPPNGSNRTQQNAAFPLRFPSFAGWEELGRSHSMVLDDKWRTWINKITLFPPQYRPVHITYTPSASPVQVSSSSSSSSSFPSSRSPSPPPAEADHCPSWTDPFEFQLDVSIPF